MSTPSQNSPISLNSFQSPLQSEKGDILSSNPVIKDTLLRIQTLLKENKTYSPEIEKIERELMFRSMMLETVFNHIYSGRSYNIMDDTTSPDEESDLLYDYTPLLGIFYQGKPVFTNFNYVRGLGGESVNEVKQNLIEGKSLDTYYTPQSAQDAKIAVSKLAEGKGYKDLVLETKTGRLLSRNSFGNKAGLEIRIGDDITNGRFQEVNKNTQFQEIYTLKTQELIKTYADMVKKTVSLDEKSAKVLSLFYHLSKILDQVWDHGQYVANTTIEPEENEGESTLFPNNNYQNNIATDESKATMKNYAKKYDPATELLIKSLWRALREDGYYTAEFSAHLQDGSTRTFAWFRKLLVDGDFGIYRTFGIGNDAISDANVEIMKSIN